MIQSYRDLDVWKLAIELAARVYQICEKLPKHETYGLAIQLQRSCVSVASNIAEGHARDSTREFLRFVSIAMSSLAECETQLILVERLRRLSTQEILVDTDVLGRKLRGLQKSLAQKISAAEKLRTSPQSRAPSPGATNA